VKADVRAKAEDDINDDFEVFDRLIEQNRQQGITDYRQAAPERQQAPANKPQTGRGLDDSFDFYDELKRSEISSRRRDPAGYYYDTPKTEPARPQRTEPKRPPKVDPLPEDHFFERF